MSVKAISWALDDVKGVHPTQKLVLVALANEAASDGQAAFISAATIAEVTGIGDRQVRNHLKDLEAVGLISRGDQRRAAYIPLQYRPVVYNLNLTAVGRVKALMKGKPKRAHQGDANLLRGRNPSTGVNPSTPEPQFLSRGEPQRTPDRKSDRNPATGNPLTQEITPVERIECKGCNKHFTGDQVTSTGYSRDCLILGPDPEPVDIGPGRAAVLEMLAKRRKPSVGIIPTEPIEIERSIDHE